MHLKAMLFGAIALFACASAQAQTLRIGISSDPDALDPTVSRTVSGRQVFAGLCDKLIDIDPKLNLVPQLATAWKWEDGDKTLVLTLRSGVRFHDGSFMDGAAVAASLQRHLTLPGSTRKAELGPVQSVEVTGPLEVKIHLPSPFSPMLAALSDRAGMITSTKAAALSSDAFAQDPVCAGPFSFHRRVALDRIELDRFPDYWNAGAIHFDHVIYLPVPDATVRGQNLRAGALDMIENVQTSDIAAMKADPRVKLAIGPSLAAYYIAVNIAHGPRAKTPLGQSALVREALDLAIDRKALTQVVFDGLYVPGNQSVPPGNPFYIRSLPVPARDLDRARALVKQAGFDRVKVQMLVPNITSYQQAGEVIQSMAAEAGIDVQLQTMETATLLAQWTAGEFESVLILWSGRTDVDANLYNFNACGAALNGGGYCNHALDAALDAARGTTDFAKRYAAYETAAKIYLADRPYIYLYHPALIFGMAAKLSGFQLVPDSLIRLPGMQMQP